jgi:hypothetical protein
VLYLGSAPPSFILLCIKAGGGQFRDGYFLTALLTAQFGKGCKSLILGARSSSPETPKFSRFKRRSTSQAGRRGFEPRLPLHVFQDLRQPGPNQPRLYACLVSR